jgi:hypothetical protein
MDELGCSLCQPYVSRVENNNCPHRFNEREVTALAAVLGVGFTEITSCCLLVEKEVRRIRKITSELDELFGQAAA